MLSMEDKWIHYHRGRISKDLLIPTDANSRRVYQYSANLGTCTFHVFLDCMISRAQLDEKYFP